ncbi:MAG: MotA/TolQ/ExbB proton channel family protein [Alphaproteobacteria bacterium]|nr:MotA/TolQ/ExbB proton channel family protein [Alphaproteobacteria bacterium]
MLEDQMMKFALLGAEWVMWLLVLLSFACIAVAAERLVYHFNNRTDRSGLDKALGGFLAGGALPELRQGLSGLDGIEARVLGAGVDAGHLGPAAAEEAIIGAMTFEKLKLERGLIVLGTTGSNAPFIGLFGTVLGIIKAFHDLSLDSAEGSTAVMAGISEALVATAIGLMVAIPAVVLYNYFQRRNKELTGRLESLSHMLLSRLHGPKQQGA